MNSLPDDVWMHCFSYVPVGNILKVALTCRSFANLVGSPYHWYLKCIQEDIVDQGTPFDVDADYMSQFRVLTWDPAHMGARLEAMGSDLHYTESSGVMCCRSKQPLCLTHCGYAELTIVHQNSFNAYQFGVCDDSETLIWNGAGFSEYFPNSTHAWTLADSTGVLSHKLRSISYGLPYRSGDTVGVFVNRVTRVIQFSVNGSPGKEWRVDDLPPAGKPLYVACTMCNEGSVWRIKRAPIPAWANRSEKKQY